MCEGSLRVANDIKQVNFQPIMRYNAHVTPLKFNTLEWTDEMKPITYATAALITVWIIIKKGLFFCYSYIFM